MDFTFKPSCLSSLKRPSSDSTSPESKIAKKSESYSAAQPPVELKLKPPTFFSYGQNQSKTESLSTTSSASSSKFIFGQNIAAKVIVEDKEAKNGDKKENNAFSELARQAENGPKLESEGKLTLDESAAEYISKNSVPVLSESSKPVQIFTGEEDESIQFEKIVVVYLYDKGSSSWTKLGVGLFHLNDNVGGNRDKSRIIIRNSSTFKVMVNTIIWPGMHLSYASEKAIRLSAMMEDKSVRIYTLQSKPEEAEMLFDKIQARIDKSQPLSVAKSEEKEEIKDHVPPKNEEESSLSSSNEEAESKVFFETESVTVEHFNTEKGEWVRPEEELILQLETDGEAQTSLHLLQKADKQPFFSSCLPEGFKISDKSEEKEILGVFNSIDFEENETFILLRLKFTKEKEIAKARELLEKEKCEEDVIKQAEKSKAFKEMVKS